MRQINLPAHLRAIARVWVDQAVLEEPPARRALERLGDIPVTVVPEGDGPPTEPGPGDTLYLKRYKGRFLRSCPGTRSYRCCGYGIIHMGENCPMDCTYCILNAYFQDRVLKVWGNQAEMFEELEQSFHADEGRLRRVGTGEFTDSLALEPLTGQARDLVGFLTAHPHVCLELKSKAVDLSWMDAATRPDRVLPAWSLNATTVADTEEEKTASLEERLAAARTCAQNGFRVCLHFDPIIHHPGWEQGYGETVEMIFDYLRPRDIAYVSLGSFRFMPELKHAIEERYPDTRYIYGEFIQGLDNKHRLIRPLRVAQLRFMAERLRSGGLTDQLYFCMESDQVWQAALGYTPRDLGGLEHHLLNRAFARRVS